MASPNTVAAGATTGAAANQPPAGALGPAYQREWALFSTYCQATGAPALPTTLAALRGFFRQVSGAPATRRRRLLAIAAAHRAAGCLLYQPPDPTPSQRDPGAWLRAPGALIAACPMRGWPAGFAGRRDAFLIVLIRVLGHTHSGARGITPADIDIGDGLIRIRGDTVPATDDAATCPRCAVARWLTALDVADGLAPRTLQDELTTPAAPTIQAGHDHRSPETGRWRATGPLLPPIDRYGWRRDQKPLSRCSIGTRLSLAATRERPPEPPQAPPAPESGLAIDDDAVTALLTKLEDDTAALDARIAAILDADAAGHRAAAS
jgi:hypothetical protein